MFDLAKDQTTLNERAILRKLRVWIIALGLACLLAGIGALAIPGVGPFIAAGPIMGALAGLGVGGAVGGLIGALVLTRLMTTLLYGVGANDMSIYAIVLVLLATAALLASYFPARRVFSSRHSCCLGGGIAACRGMGGGCR